MAEKIWLKDWKLSEIQGFNLKTCHSLLGVEFSELGLNYLEATMPVMIVLVIQSGSCMVGLVQFWQKRLVALLRCLLLARKNPAWESKSMQLILSP